MIKAVVIDDEKHCLVTMEYLLQQVKEVTLLACIQDSREAAQQIRALKPDIVFIDVQMPNITGFEVLQQFEVLPFKVVFTTAYDQYAVKALKMNALDYLQKPVALEEIKEVLEKYRQEQLLQTREQISQLYRFSEGKILDTIALSVQEGLIFVKQEEITYIEGSGCYSNIIVADGTKHLVSKTIAVFEDVLHDNPLFFRPHKSYIVNLKFIRQYIRGEGGEIIMKDGKGIAVSRNKKQDFLNLFQRI